MFCVPGTFVKITSPLLFTPKTLFEVVVALLEEVRFVNRKPEFPAVPCVISNLFPGVVVPIPTLPLSKIELSVSVLTAENLGTKLIVPVPPILVST